MMNDASVAYEENIGLVRQVARKCFTRLAAIGAVEEFDDVMQELSIVFLKTHEKFDQAQGNAFSTYFTRSAYNHMNRLVKEIEVERIENRTASFEELSAGMSEGEADLLELIPSEALPPDQEWERNRAITERFDSLSPTAQLIVQWLIDPPEELTEERRKQAAHQAHIHESGCDERYKRQHGLQGVCNFLLMVSNIPERRMKVLIARAKAELNSIMEAQE